MEVVDTHCHLQFDKLADNIEQVMERAKNSGVTRMICVGTSIVDSKQAIEYAARFDNVWASVGAHPHDGKDFDFDSDLAGMRELLKSHKVVAVGEIGLDYYKNYSPKLEQEKLLRAQIEEAGTKLPFIFHVRDAWKDFWRIFDSYKGLAGVVHSFSAYQEQLDEIMVRNLYVSLNGIMTFTKDEGQLEAAKNIPGDRLLLETDAPFLTPAPYRDSVCEPKHVRTIAEFVANLREQSLDELADTTTNNAENLFGIT